MNKTKGELKCGEIKKCSKCPLRPLVCEYYINDKKTINEIFNELLKDIPELKEIESFFRKKLDKELENEKDL